MYFPPNSLGLRRDSYYTARLGKGCRGPVSKIGMGWYTSLLWLSNEGLQGVEVSVQTGLDLREGQA